MKHLEKRLNYKKIFDKNSQLPKTKKECLSWFEELACELSPENLSCDGEASASDIKRRQKEIWACWSELETIYGKKVDVNSFGV